MRILITGGAGYIGSHTARRLLENKRKIVVLDNLKTGFREALPREVSFVQGDVGNTELVSKVLKAEKIDSVIHFAASLDVNESMSNALKYYENNFVQSLGLLKACVAQGVKRFVFSSTAAVYGDPAIIPVTEDAPTHPLSPYGASKLFTERLLRDVSLNSGLQYVILRYFNVAGARRDGTLGQMTQKATHLIKVISEVASRKRESVEIFGTNYPTPDGTGVRDYIHVEDLAAAHLDAIAYLEKGGSSDTFNVGYGRGFSVKEVIETMESIVGVSFLKIERPRREGDSAAVVADSTKIKRALGWKPQCDNLRIICETSFKWETKFSGADLKKAAA